MKNNELNKRVLKALEEKIAIDEFRKKENLNIKKGKNIKNNNLFKVASFFIITVLVAGNVYTYATYQKNLFSYTLEKIGILEENLVDVNHTEKNNEIELTLENYGIDNDTLIIGYKLKLNKQIDYFLEYLIDETQIINEKNTFILGEKGRSIFYKISDTEYEIIKIYELAGNKLTDTSKLKTNLKLYKEYEGSIENLLGEWNFEINLDKDAFSLNYKKFTLENKKVVFEQIEKADNQSIVPEVELLEIKKSDIATKLVLYMEKYFTNVDYFVEIEDENGVKILEDNIQTINGGFPNEIIIRKLDFDSEIKINIYEKTSEKELLSKACIVVDLKNDLKENI